MSPEPEIRSLEFPEKDRPLQRDVSTLGALVGEMLKEQGGDELFERVETWRRTAIRRRERGRETGRDAGRRDGPHDQQGDEHGEDGDLDALVRGLEPMEAELVVRAFLSYFRVVNLAEQIHRIRRRRDYQRRSHDDPTEAQRGSFLHTFHRLRDAGVEAGRLRELLADLRFEPVFTAHPTEATRRTLLEKELRIAKILVRRLDPSLTPDEEEKARSRIRDEITTAWQTEEHPFVRPTVRHEMDHVLYHLTDVIYRVVPALYESLADALHRVYGEEPGEEQGEKQGEGDPSELPEVLRCASWVGGDMDGNPYVSAETVRDTLAEHRRRILACYRRDVGRLARRLSQSDTRVGVSADLRRRLDDYRARFPEEAARVPERHRDMPYRVFLHLVDRRLELSGGAALGAGLGAGLGYGEAADFLRDLERVDESLTRHHGAHAGRFGVRRLIRRVRTFGFHLATLDLRQDAQVHRRVVGALLDDEGWSERPAEDRLHRLRRELDGLAERGDPPDDAEVRRTLEVFRAVAEARASGLGERAVGPFVISMTEGADDVLTILLLARRAGLVETDDDGEDHVPLDVAPLFETVDDLQAAPAVLEELLTDGRYRRHLARRGDRQMVMIGYSDSNKDGGLAAARWALHRGQEAMVEVLRRHGVRPVIFHGRGGTISRGGGKTYRAVLAAPRGTVAGRLRVTEQGEVINGRYGLRGIAHRTLERTVGAVIEATARQSPVDPREERWREIMDEVGRASRETYRDLVWRDRNAEDGDFYEYFRRATPVDVIERMMIGSRPSARRSKKGLENLRAIPWVFSWTQSRHVLPGWYGLGTGLEHAVREHGRDAVAEMVADWPFVATLLEDVEMVLAKADLGIAERYAALAGEVGERIFPQIRGEMERTVRWVLDLQGRESLLEADRTLRRSIRLRNPYVDPMSLLQVDLLRRWRDGGRKDEDLEHALLATVHGIAQGLRNTG